MATRSLIGKQLPDGTIKAIYCHNDGYLDYNGRMLINHYNSEDKVDELLELGDISVLAKNISAEYNKIHNFDNPVKDVCIAYGRDRGEVNTSATIYKNDEEFIAQGYIDYFYLFDISKKWIVYEQGQLKNFHLLDEIFSISYKKSQQEVDEEM